MQLIMKLYTILNMMKGITPGYTTACKDKMLIVHEGDTYVVSFTKIENPSKDPYDDINKYLK